MTETEKKETRVGKKYNAAKDPTTRTRTKTEHNLAGSLWFPVASCCILRLIVVFIWAHACVWSGKLFCNTVSVLRMDYSSPEKYKLQSQCFNNWVCSYSEFHYCVHKGRISCWKLINKWKVHEEFRRRWIYCNEKTNKTVSSNQLTYQITITLIKGT